MEQQDITQQETENKTKKVSPKKAQYDAEALLRRIDALEKVVIRMAHNSGTSHQVLIQNGLTPYTPNKNDMTKFKTA